MAFFLLTTQVNINFGRSKSKIVIFTKIIFAIELEFAKSAKFTARENFALYGNFETGDVTPTKIGVHACDINPYLHKIFEPIPND